MEQILNAITLKTADYGENDKMLTLFSLEKGIVCVGAKGVKRDKARLKFTAEPFCFSEFVITEKSGRKTLKNATCRKSYFRICQNLKAYFCASVTAEFVLTFFKDYAEVLVFENLVFALENYLAGKTNITLVKFLLEGLSQAGYGLDFSGCAICGEEISDRVFLNAGASSFLCENCKGEGCKEFRTATYQKLKSINEKGYEELVEEDGEDIINCLKLLKLYVQSRSGVKLRSFDFVLG